MAACCGPRSQRHQEFSARNRSRTPRRECGPDEVGLDQLEGAAAPRDLRRGPGPGAIEHVAVVVDAGHAMAGCRQRNGDAAGPDRQLQDAAADTIGERPVEVDVARVVGQVEVVEARQGGRGRGVRAPRFTSGGPRSRPGAEPRAR